MSKHSVINKIFAVVVAILAVQALAVLAWNVVVHRSSATEEGGKPPQEEATPSEIEVEPLEEDVVNILLCGVDDAAGLTDVIIVASFDVKNSTINVLQIPRDTYIGEEYRTGKINQIYFAHRQEDEPIRGLINVIGEKMSLPIDHYVLVTLQGFREIVDAMGGITVDIPQRIEFLPDKIIEPGIQHLNGEQAEWFVRYRAGYKEGDIGRINAQQLMIDALIQAVHDEGRMKMLQLASQNYSKVTTDLSLVRALSLASAAFQVEKENVNVFTLEGYGKMYNGFAVYEADSQKLTDLLNLYFRPYGGKVNRIAMPKVPVVIPEVPEEELPEEEPPFVQIIEESSSSEEEQNNSNQFETGDIAGDFPID